MNAVQVLRLLGVNVFMPVGDGGGDYINSVNGDGYGDGNGYGYGYDYGYGNGNGYGYDSDYYYGKNTVWLIRNGR